MCDRVEVRKLVQVDGKKKDEVEWPVSQPNSTSPHPRPASKKYLALPPPLSAGDNHTRPDHDHTMAATLESQCDELYRKALEAAITSPAGKGKNFTADELVSLGVVATPTAIMPLLQRLVDTHLVRLLHLENNVVYELRSREIAEKLQQLESPPDLVIYSHIESAGTNGTWTKSLKQRTQLPLQGVNKAIKLLESRGLIKLVKNIRNPTQKSYIVSHLEPGAEVTGGPWHTEGELDMEMITITADIIVRFIESKSWAKGRIKVERDRSISPIMLHSEPPEQSGLKRKRPSIESEDIEDMPPMNGRRRRLSSSNGVIETQIAHPPGYQHYPTAQTVLAFVQQSGILKDAIVLKQEDIQGLLDVLALDGRLEKMGPLGYRTVKGVKSASDAMKNAYVGRLVEDGGDEADETGLTQTPCGRCPVYNLCQEGGPVNADNCEYFEVWLKA